LHTDKLGGAVMIASLDRQGFGYPQFNSYKLHRTLETRT